MRLRGRHILGIVFFCLALLGLQLRHQAIPSVMAQSGEQLGPDRIPGGTKNKSNVESALRPSKKAERALGVFEGNREPGISNLELEIERLPDGRYRALNVDPNGPFSGIVAPDDIFESLDDIPAPKRH